MQIREGAYYVTVPPLWRDMTPEQKGALLLAHHEGKVIEFFSAGDEWEVTPFPAWSDDAAYRLRPEPRRETVEITGFLGHGNKWWEGRKTTGVNYKITFDLLDGEPDCTSIKMEKL